MVFNSIEFAFFLPIVFGFYWLIDCTKTDDVLKLRMQNTFVVIASYVFYGWWNWRFLLLIAFTSFCSWGSGLLICRAASQGKSKAWMVLNVVINLAILGVFKYYDFFLSEFGRLFGIDTSSLLLRMILPVGISFYTFQALSYSIDIYRKRIEPTRDIIAFFAFIAFFPQLVAGPVERATNLLPQFLQKRRFSYDLGMDGMRQILWGLFKKVVVADGCAIYVDQVWNTWPTQTGSTLLLAAVLFAFQIYGDFSGYSDIAVGTAKLFGIQLMCNFNYPYFSRDIAEFWRRWHISLTTWFRDYVYIPLGGSRPEISPLCKYPEVRRKEIIIRNTFVIFLVCGIWHGANWTFLVWGAYNALLFLPLILLGRNRKYTNQVAEDRLLPSWREALQILLTFALVVVGWIIFRAETVLQGWDFICGICQGSLFQMPSIPDAKRFLPLPMVLATLFVLEWFNRSRSHGLSVEYLPVRARVTVCAYILVLIFLFGNQPQTFIYFQF